MVDKISSLACCADLYSLPLVRLLLGDSWHPGGLTLTRALAKAINLSSEDHLLDAACGRGASALMLAQVYKCRVVGIDSSLTALEQARKESRRYRLDQLVTFREEDAMRLAFPDGAFTAAICECATTFFTHKEAAIGEIVRVLQPGGRLALSDVTFAPERLPQALDVPLARSLCIPLGMGPQEYVKCIEQGGLVLESEVDHSYTLAQLIGKVELFLGAGEPTNLLGPAVEEMMAQAASALACLRELLERKELGYWAFTARKP
jgi:SAM-dependent methyltransferase